jgi:hypothetical protein
MECFVGRPEQKNENEKISCSGLLVRSVLFWAYRGFRTRNRKTN